MEKKLWTRELAKLLILKYQEHENLYNARHPCYLDRVKRSISLFDICKELRKRNKNVSVEEVKSKIHSLRTQYIKELQKIATSKRSGVAIEDVYEPRLWCFTHLQFLKSHCAKRNFKPKEKHYTQIERQKDKSGSGIVMEDVAVAKNAEPQPRFHDNKRVTISEYESDSVEINSISQSLEELEDSSFSSVNPICPPKRKEKLESSPSNISAVAIYWSEKLEKLQPKQRIFAEKAINDILFEAELCTLNRNSIQINQSSSTVTPSELNDAHPIEIERFIPVTSESKIFVSTSSPEYVFESQPEEHSGFSIKTEIL